MRLLILLTSAAILQAQLVLGCDSNEFACDVGRCIPSRWLCDGDPDCSDGTDEVPANCRGSTRHAGVRECRSTEFQCANGNCIPSTWHCDGADDCRDGSDEIKSTCPEQTCSISEFRCNSGQCITRSWRCDGQQDCNDGSDEDSCEETTVPANKFRCGSGITIPLKWRCDGEKDCHDGSDEEGCEGDGKSSSSSSGSGSGSSSSSSSSSRPRTSSTICRPYEFQCGSYCILDSWVCDGTADCAEGEDEAKCERTCGTTEFTCGSGECVPGHHRCNGARNCRDGSDELQCATIPPTISTPTCNTTTHFRCSDSTCIPKEKLCNGQNDCGDWQDENEETCGVNECERNNGGCTQRCVDTREGYHCECFPGYRLVGKYTCEDINECQEQPGICSQECTNTVGRFHCSCSVGYERDPRNYKACKAAEGETYLLFSHSYDIRSLRLKDNDMQEVVTDTRSATAVDFLFETNEILWSDNKENKIYRAKMNDPDRRIALVQNDHVSADGLAVDWIHKNIYYTDTLKDSIVVMSWDTRLKKSIVTEEVGQPRAIVVDPIRGYVYWTDWGIKPKIERSGLDGADRQAIVESPNVHWPNGITIDYSTKRLFWCDGKHNTISSSRFDGSDLQVVLYSPNVLRLPYSIAVFEDTLYWTDWSRLALFSANKFTGADIKSVTTGLMVESPKVVQVFHKYKQPEAKNVCDDLTPPCSHFCMRASRATEDEEPRALCACPEGLWLAPDGRACLTQEILTPTTAKSTIDDRDNKINVVVNESNADGPGFDRRIDGEPLETPSNNLPLIAGLTSAAAVIVVVALVGFLAYRRLQNRNIRCIRFQNPVYRKTTDVEDTDGGGFIIGRDDMLYQPQDFQYPPNLHTDVSLSEADDTPLAPKDKDEV